MELHVGNLVLDKLREKGMKKSEFARRINKSRQNVQDIFKRQSLDTHLLFDICRVLEYNFFEILSGRIDFPTEGILADDQVLYKASKGDKQKKNQLQSITKQLKSAEKEIAYLKKINALLEKKKGASAKKKENKKK